MDDSGPDRSSKPRKGPAVAVVVSDRQRTKLPAATARALRTLARDALQAEGVAEGELTLSFVDPPEIEELHVRYMDEPGPTDVLSFPMGEDGLLGDVIVCPAVAASNNPEDPDAELRLLVVHGVLHILGYDHHAEADRRSMWSRQERYSGVHVR
jgi:probable rRNA maturation factor